MELFYAPGMKLDEVEKRVILYALRIYRGNQTKTAENLGITTKTLYAKLKLYGAMNENKDSEHSADKDNGDRGASYPGDANPLSGNIQSSSKGSAVPEQGYGGKRKTGS